MNDHYSGHDPLLGCGMLILSAGVALALAILLVLFVLEGVR